MGRPLSKRFTPTARAFVLDFKRRRPREYKQLMNILDRRYCESALQDEATKTLMKQCFHNHLDYDIFQ